MASDRLSRFKGKLELSTSKLNTLLEITNAINDNSTSEELYNILKEVLTSLQIDKFALFVYEGKWKLAQAQRIDKRKLKGIPIQKVIEEHPEISTLSASELKGTQTFEIVVPVYHKSKPLACILLADIEEERLEMSPIIRHLKFIQTLANIIVVSLENKRLNKEYIKQIEVKKELELTQNMQSLLFPRRLPNDDQLKVKAYYEPHSEVGGDYYDVIELDNERLAICIADVSGKGMPAALLMANFQANLRALLNVTQNLEELIKMTNSKVIESANYEKFITLFIAIYDKKNRELHYLNAGHQPAILRNGNSFSLLNKGCTVLGMFDELPSVQSEKLKLKEQSVLLTYTDGLSELENNAGEQLEVEGIMEIVESEKSLGKIIKALEKKIDQLKAGSGISDDITFLALEFAL